MNNFFRLEELSFRYPQDGYGLEPVSLSIEGGEILLVEGPSGCGKSTLARCLVGLIPHLYHGYLSGKIWLNDQLTESTPLWQITRQVGLVFQNPASQLLSSSVEEEIIFGLENLGLSTTEINQRVDAALGQFSLEKLRTRRPQTLSSGEQQKLALASILARQPDGLVLDEPLAMLDPTAAMDFVDLLGEQAEAGKTLVICEHRHEYLATLPDLRTVHLGNGHSALTRPRQKVTGTHADAGFELQLDNLHVRRAGQEILQNIDLNLCGGQVVALVGRNGAGKTTLLRALAGLQAYDGQITVRGNLSGQALQMGIVFQNPDLQLFNASVRAEILYRLNQPDMQYYHELLDTLELSNYEDTPPLLLSEGEKRRVALATILMRQPHHGVLLDEPSLGQDGHHKQILMRTMHALAASGRLVILATHDLELAFRADQLILMTPGNILAYGAVDKIRRDSALWERSGIRIPAWLEIP